MLPKHFCKDDRKFIIEQLSLIPADYAKLACEKYSEVFQEVYHQHPVSYQKENRARREANIRLRRYIKAVRRRIQWD